MEVISMENTECLNFFPKRIRDQFIQDLKYIKSLLEQIFNQREVSGEDMGEIIDMTKLAPLQKKLKNKLDRLSKICLCRLMLLSSIEKVLIQTINQKVNRWENEQAVEFLISHPGTGWRWLLTG